MTTQRTRRTFDTAFKLQVIKMIKEGKAAPKELLIPFEAIVAENVDKYMK